MGQIGPEANRCGGRGPIANNLGRNDAIKIAISSA